MKQVFALVGCIAALLIIGARMLPSDSYAQHDSYYDTLGNWQKNDRNGDINLSTFVFRDINRNGRYDIGDKPMAGVVSDLYFGAKSISRAYSNENGFANFSSSRVESNLVIHAKGDYTFMIQPPPGWEISTENQKQTREYKDVPGSIGGGGFERMLEPVGLLPPLYIRGRAAEGEGIEVTLLGKGGKLSQTTQTNAEGDFEFQGISPGTYTIKSNEKMREVTVTHTPVHIGTLRADHQLKPAQTVATFEDFGMSGLRKVPNGYVGVNWFNMNAMKDYFSEGSVGYINGTVSGNYISYLSSGHPATIYRDMPFDFHSAYLAVSWPKGHGETAIVEMWRGDTKVAHDVFPVSVFGPVHYQPEMYGVTKVKITAKHYWQIFLDDVALTTQ